MFGMFSIDAAEGMREQKTANDTRRVAIAKAFEDFRRDNPYATALDLQNFTDSLVGADFFLRPGNATGAALERIAAENRNNRLIRDRKRQLEAIEEETGFVNSVEEFFTNQFKNTGDVKSALTETQNMFGSSLPGDPARDAQIKKTLDGLSRRADTLANNIIYTGLGENSDQIQGMMESGMDFESLRGSLPVYLQGESARNLLEGKFSNYDRSIRDRVFKEAADFVKDPVLSKSIGMGDLSAIREKLSPEFYDRYNKEGELDEYIIGVHNAIRGNEWDAEKVAALDKAYAAGNTALTQRLEAQKTAFASFAGGDSTKDKAIQNALGQLATQVINPTAIPKIINILETTDNTTSQDILAEIDAAIPNATMPASEYQRQQQEAYLAIRGLGGDAPQTFMQYVGTNFGDDGYITQTQANNIEATTPLQIQTTAELYGGTNKFGLATSSAYAQHVNDITTAIGQQQRSLQELIEVKKKIRNQSNFFATTRGQGGEPESQMKALNETDAKIDSMIGTIKNNIENLGKKQDEVRALGARSQNRNRQFNAQNKEFDGAEIKDAAKAMANYLRKNNIDINTNRGRLTALQYAAAMGVTGGRMSESRNQKFSKDQRALAAALISALP